MTNQKERVKTGTFEAFKDFTLAVTRGERKVDPNEPKIWIESRESDADKKTAVQFTSLKAGITS